MIVLHTDSDGNQICIRDKQRLAFLIDGKIVGSGCTHKQWLDRPHQVLKQLAKKASRIDVGYSIK